jgi:tetratricopeptide (TPR) repeat protein
MVESDKNLPASYIPWIKFMYAYIYEDKGEKQKAIDYLKDIIAHYPDYDSIGQVKEMLERIEESLKRRNVIEDTERLPQVSD